jgi:hypothetical protein
MDNNVLYNKLIERVISERPDLAPFAEIFQHINTSDDKNEPENQKREIDVRFRKLASAARLLKEDFDDAMDELDDLAHALGACDECWGENKRCPKCRGNGVSGWRTPNTALFRSLILPALQKIPWLEIKEIK